MQRSHDHTTDSGAPKTACPEDAWAPRELGFLELQACRDALHERHLVLTHRRAVIAEREDELLSEPRMDWVDTATVQRETAMLELESDAELTELRQIEAALARFTSGRYGQCVACGSAIPVERLRLIPEAAYCVDCGGRRR